MTYERFTYLYGQMNGSGLISPNEDRAMKEITAFRQKYPLQYEAYRERLKKDRKE